ncbi:hypothetical protein [Streptomyces fuscichromogenes]|uniref:Lipoprotein n=1 Tax=Streptomyces fuscichromogenes TaxID=1324013 RepID=A0A917XIA2_9ACTN|nr:hypothetical protein [Streptomyces fuscichromogenes]GGN25163.1 hypothetical protein GCM10011578_058890 [Streptomyces fuscichromogenes]
MTARRWPAVGRGAGALVAVLLVAGCGAGAGASDTADRTPGDPAPVTSSPSSQAAPSAPAAPATSAAVPASLAPPVRRTARPGRASPSVSADGGRVPGPDLSRRVPVTSSRRPSTSATAVSPAPRAAAGAVQRSAGTTIRIGGWSAGVIRGGQDEVDACQDAVQWAGPDIGTEDGYAMRTVVIVGHDYCGFDLFATLRVGTRVTVGTPRGTWSYTVYAHYVTPGRGAPAAGLYWGDLTLQSCVGPDTGFSYLVRD